MDIKIAFIEELLLSEKLIKATAVRDEVPLEIAHVVCVVGTLLSLHGSEDYVSIP